MLKWEGLDLKDGLESVGSGWGYLVMAAFRAKPEDIKIVQVKEKFGGLRIYTDSHDEGFAKTISALEEASFTICEVCGQSGELRNLDWARTLCDKDYEYKLNKIAERKLSD